MVAKRRYARAGENKRKRHQHGVTATIKNLNKQRRMARKRKAAREGGGEGGRRRREGRKESSSIKMGEGGGWEVGSGGRGQVGGGPQQVTCWRSRKTSTACDDSV